MTNLSGHHELNFLLQRVRDDPALSFDAVVQYLRENSRTIEGHATPKKRIMNTMGMEEGSVNSKSTTSSKSTVSSKSAQETLELFESVARESNILQAYQSFNSKSMRQSLSIPDEIWKELEPTTSKRKSKKFERKSKNHKIRGKLLLPRDYPLNTQL